MKNDFLTRLDESLSDLGLSPSSPLLVAFSGGPDSMALLHMLHELNYSKIIALYINYHDSSYTPLEQEIVVKNAKDLNVELIIDNTTLEAMEGNNFENWARDYRYSLFAKIVSNYNLEGVVTGHHLDDLLETYLIQKERHSLVSFYGLKSLVVLKDTKVFRPLLKYSKLELISHLKENNITYFDDPTNLNIERTRNRIRQEKLSEVQKHELLSEIDVENEKLSKTHAIIKELTDKKQVRMDDYLSLNEDDKHRLLYELLSSRFPLLTNKKTNALVNKAYDFLKGQQKGHIYLIENEYLYFDEDCFFISHFRVKQEYSYTIDKPGVYSFEALSIDLTNGKIFNVFIDSYPITIRPCRKGDVIATKLKSNNARHFIKSQKVPTYLRDLYPVIVDKNSKVIYVPFYSDIKNKLIPLQIKLIK